jgi:hypothetical protein
MRELNLKITNQLAIEIGKISRFTLDIELGGVEPLKECSELIESAVNNHAICCDKNKLSCVFGEDVDFFYLVQLMDKNKGEVLSEVGIGNIRNNILNREFPLFYESKKTGRIMSSRPRNFYYSDETKYIAVSNYIPKTINELLLQTNSVITSSSSPSIPNLIKMEPNTFLARTDGEIAAHSFDAMSEQTRGYICNYTKQLILKSSQLNVKKIKTKQLVLEPTKQKSADAKKGTIIYDDENDNLLFYDGKKWKIFMWQDSK